MPNPIPTEAGHGLCFLSRLAAEARGYVSISNAVDLKQESEIASSMAKSMKGADAVWIRTAEGVELARRKTDLRHNNGEDYSKPTGRP